MRTGPHIDSAAADRSAPIDGSDPAAEPQAARDTSPPSAGVFVLGMHRAGTSALAGAIGLLGVPLGTESAIKPASPVNPQGFWEIEPLTAFNEELLVALGGSWSSPPRLTGSWQEDGRLEPYRERGRELFAELHPTPQWIWKDPRNSLLLPFWTSVLAVKPILVISHRSPLEIHRSLAARDGISKPLALALWERYLRAALEAAEGQRVLVLRYSALVADPRGACDRLAGFLKKAGVSCDGASEDRLMEFLRDDLRRSRLEDADAERDPDISVSQRRLLSALEELEGEHSALPVIDLPPETSQTEMLIGARRDAVLALTEARARFRAEIHATSLREEAIREKLAASQARNRGLQNKLADVRARLQQQREQVERSRAELARAREKVRDAHAELERARERLRTVNQDCESDP
jgi:hypothetical protein